MGDITVKGGIPLYGKVCIQGSKNAALPILAASLLHEGISIIHNCPRILDVENTVQILREAGCLVKWQENSLIISAGNIQNTRISSEYATQMRSSVIFLGSLLGRMGSASIPLPGGCTIGKRPIDIHLSAMENMGVRITEENEMILAKAERLKGTKIMLRFPSVGATENTILAAVLAEGTTIIQNAAQEPEIAELCRFLNEKGAKIKGAGSEKIVIEGVRSLQDSEFVLMSDRIVAGTYLMAAMSAGGEICLEKAPIFQMTAQLKVLKEMGASMRYDKDQIQLKAPRRAKSLAMVMTRPYPGFPTDLQSQLLAVLCRAEGRSKIIENIFEGRYQIVPQLRKMGAKIEIISQEAQIEGVEKLEGTAVRACELRGGAALIIAGLGASGVTKIEDSWFIKRGYEDICGDLRTLGAVVG
ncbi:MAG: UDP-N-acetylglucosamine 1-carboxyvinyltransferase [Lachnospiraceae bacterium]|nr:UDP-N-acetylglucosamine 1-carboxyvinyltransferase [Robinsoniella sp.]MDY3766750.1 UDP-N-acetylglucosamine 1-carboxyvinyltransferase [Lachnospiraceae bacterium]